MKPNHKKVKFSLTWKIAAIFSLVFAGVFLLMLESISYNVTAKADTQVMADLTQVLESIANNVDVEMLMDLSRNGEPNAQGFSDDPRYETIINWLDTVHSTEPDAWPYLYIPAEQEGYIYFVVDLLALYDSEAASSFMELYKSNSGYILIGLERQTFREVDSWLVASIKELAKAIRTKNGNSDSRLASWLDHLADWLTKTRWFEPRAFGTYQDQFGRWASGYMPLLNSDGEKVAGIGVDFRADTINQIRSDVRSTVELTFLISYLIMLPLVILISIKLTKPIVELTNAATSIGLNNNPVDVPQPSEKKRSDEIDVLEQVLFNTYQKLQNANQQLQGLSHQLITDREQYRKELARDLHDNVLSYLSVLSSAQPSELNPQAMQENYRQAIARLRATIFSLRSPTMEYGLPMAIEDFIDHFEAQTNDGDPKIIVDFAPSQVRFDHTTETHIFRIVQQAFENAVEHSKASRIQISGNIHAELIEVTIDDDGKGIQAGEQDQFDRTAYESRKKFGMVGMIERAALIGAQLEISPGSNGGTVVHLHWTPQDN
jgi:signal transduction histidine kinase